MKSLKSLNKIFVAALIAVASVCAFAGCDKGGNSETIAQGDKGSNPEAVAQGEFRSLQKAYDDGLLTLEDLKNIAYEYNGGKSYNEQIMADFIPAGKAALSEATKTAIKESRAKNLRETMRPDGRPVAADAIAENVYIDGYYGTYNGAVAVMIEDDYGAFDAAMWMVEVEGVNIYYNSGNRITIWKQI